MLELLVPKTLDAMVAWHTRRGIRKGCLCSFCVEKISGTRYIGHTPFPVRGLAMFELQKQSALFPEYPPIDDFNEMCKELIRRERSRKRNIVRERLRIAKEEIL